MIVRLRAQLGDILVSTIILAVAIIGLVKTFDYPDRAAMWPTWIMQLLILCTAAHLAIMLWRIWSSGKQNSHNQDDAP